MDERTCVASDPGDKCSTSPKRIFGLCDKHYKRQYKRELAKRDPATIRKLDRSPADTAARFWAKIDKNGPIPTHRPELGPCWVWTTPSIRAGYGSFTIGKRAIGAHRVAYEMAHGPIPTGLHLDHLCVRPLCVPPQSP